MLNSCYWKLIVKDDTSNELKVLKTDFGGDYDPVQLESQFLLLPAVFHQFSPVDFRDICKHLQEMKTEKRQMLKNMWKIIRIVLTSGATSATPERSFSMQRRLKTWIRSTMGNKRYNSLAILNSHTTEVVQLSLIEVAEWFFSNHDRRRDDFGTFSDKNLHRD